MLDFKLGPLHNHCELPCSCITCSRIEEEFRGTEPIEMDESDTVKELKKIFGLAFRGAISSIFLNVAEKFERGEEGDVGKAGLIGGVSTVAGQLGQKCAIKDETIGNKVGNEAKKCRLEAGVTAAAGGAAAALPAGLMKIAENVFCCGSLTQKGFTTIMEDEGMACDNGKVIYEFLCRNGIVVDNVVRNRIPRSSQFLDFLQRLHLEEFEESVRNLVDLTYEEDITKGVVDVASENAIIGGAVTAGADISLDVEVLRKLADDRSEKIACQGEWAGSIESEAYARAYEKRLIVHHDDGTVTAYGSPTNEEVHIHYSAQEEHYSPAEKDGHIIHLSGGNYGDCFFEAIAYQTGESLAHHVRQKVARFVRDYPERLEKIGINELVSGGEYLGGAGGHDYGRRLKLKGYNDALIFFDQNAPNLKNYAIQALNELRDLTVDQLNVLEQHTTRNGSARIGEFNIHVLGKKVERKGFVAVDVHVPDAAARRDGARMLFRRKQMDSRKLKFIDATVAHDYDKMLIDYFKGKGDEKMINLLSQQTFDLCEGDEQEALRVCGDDQTLMDAVQQALQEMKTITLKKFQKMKDTDLEIKNELYSIKFSVLEVGWGGRGQAGEPENQRESMAVIIECPPQQVFLHVKMLFVKNKDIQMMLNLEYVEADATSRNSHQKMMVKYFDKKGIDHESVYVKNGKDWKQFDFRFTT